MAANMAREIRDLVLNQTAMMESLVNRVGDLEDMVSTGSVSTVSEQVFAMSSSVLQEH